MYSKFTLAMRSKGQLRKTRDRGDRQRLYNDIKSLRRELRQRESSAISDILKRACVVLATLTTASDDGPLSYLGNRTFDLVVIDECSQVKFVH
jgi:ATP-dependent RNA/DNA helicase IGHMBP2